MLSLRVQDLSVSALFDQISFDLKKGEILGFAGLVGAGRTEVVETIMGLRKKRRGKILVHRAGMPDEFSHRCGQV